MRGFTAFAGFVVFLAGLLGFSPNFSLMAKESQLVHVVRYVDDGVGGRAVITEKDELGIWRGVAGEVLESSAPRFFVEEEPIGKERDESDLAWLIIGIHLIHQIRYFHRVVIGSNFDANGVGDATEIF